MFQNGHTGRRGENPAVIDKYTKEEGEEDVHGAQLFTRKAKDVVVVVERMSNRCVKWVLDRLFWKVIGSVSLCVGSDAAR